MTRAFVLHTEHKMIYAGQMKQSSMKFQMFASKYRLKVVL